MKFLLEKSILSKDEEENYDALDEKAKIKFLNNLINNMTNKNNLSAAKTTYINSLAEDGFNDRDNKFITFMEKSKTNILGETAELINYFIKQNQIDPNRDNWLYNKTLYKDSINDIAYKIKALVYASNPKLQKNANRKILVQDLIDKNNRIRSIKSIQNILSQINISNKQEKDDVEDKQIITKQKDSNIGQDILKKELNDNNLTYNDIKKYLNKLYENDPNKTTAQQILNDEELFKAVKPELTKVLLSKIEIALDDKPIDELNNKLKNVINNSIN